MAEIKDNTWMAVQLKNGRAVRWAGEGYPFQKNGWPEGVYVTIKDDYIVFHGDSTECSDYKDYPTECSDYKDYPIKASSWFATRRADCLWELVNIDSMDDFIDIITN